MSENLVNQLTLNYMISKQQLAKLNKRIKEDNEFSRKSDKDIYRERLYNMFNELLNNDNLDNIGLTEEVKYAFNHFIDKSIYFFKQKDMCEDLENQRKINEDEYNSNDNESSEVDLESEDKYSNYNNNYKSNDSLETNSVQDETIINNLHEDCNNMNNDNDVKTLINNKKYVDTLDTCLEDIKPALENIVRSNKKKIKSQGVENINDIQVNWFQNVQQQYKSNKIIPRKKEIIITGHYHNK